MTGAPDGAAPPPDGAAAPPGERAPRSARVTLAQSVLALQSLLAIITAALFTGFQRVGELPFTTGQIWAAGAGLAVAFAAASGAQGRPGGTAIGWLLQVPLLAGGFLSLPVGVVGAMFVLVWAAGLRLGGRIDRERAEFREAQARLRTEEDT